MTIGTSEKRRISWQSWKPSVSGSMMSSRMRSGLSSSTSRNPSSPLAAETTSASGQRRLKQRLTTSITSGSSSTIRTFIRSPGARGFSGCTKCKDCAFRAIVTLYGRRRAGSEKRWRPEEPRGVPPRALGGRQGETLEVPADGDPAGEEVCQPGGEHLHLRALLRDRGHDVRQDEVLDAGPRGDPRRVTRRGVVRVGVHEERRREAVAGVAQALFERFHHADVQRVADQDIGVPGAVDEARAGVRVPGDDDRRAAALQAEAEGGDDRAVVHREGAAADLAAAGDLHRRVPGRDLGDGAGGADGGELLPLVCGTEPGFG